MFNLDGHVALITGGNSGLGLAYGRGLVKSGAKVAIWGRKADKNEAALVELRELGGDVDGFVCDVTDEGQIADAFAQTLERFGQVDSCFANAGGGGFLGMSHKTSRETWLGTIDLNLMSVVQTFAPVTDHMLKRQQGGRLIVTSSIAAHMGMGGAAGYSATKAAVAGLVKALAVELGAAGIRANAILPGFVETEMSMESGDTVKKAAQRRTVIGRLGQLEDMEGIAAFLASKESDFMTGQELVLDGGHTIMPI